MALWTARPPIHEGVDIYAAEADPGRRGGQRRHRHRQLGERPRPPGSILCCALARQDSGWESRYIHLNNDTPGTDDGPGWGIAPGSTSAAASSPGTIGWVGDSGNAETTTSPALRAARLDGRRGNPYASLQGAVAPGAVPCT